MVANLGRRCDRDGDEYTGVLPPTEARGPPGLPHVTLAGLLGISGIGSGPGGTIRGRRGQLMATDEPATDSDAALLTRFARSGDGRAFAALVERYGGMVLGVCRRTARHE